MAIEYIANQKEIDIDTGGLQLEDYIVKQCLDLTYAEKDRLVAVNGDWILSSRPFQVIPIMAYVCKKIIPTTKENWAISFEDVKKSIDNNTPVVCLGDFSKMSYVKGHYNTIIGYNDQTKYVFTMDPWGNSYENYRVQDDSNMYYSWNIFERSSSNSYGITF